MPAQSQAAAGPSQSAVLSQCMRALTGSKRVGRGPEACAGPGLQLGLCAEQQAEAAPEQASRGEALRLPRTWLQLGFGLQRRPHCATAMRSLGQQRRALSSQDGGKERGRGEEHLQDRRMGRMWAQLCWLRMCLAKELL